MWRPDALTRLEAGKQDVAEESEVGSLRIMAPVENPNGENRYAVKIRSRYLAGFE